MQTNRLTDYELHASQARASCRAAGLADCIHYAPNWRNRADALYAEVNALGVDWYGSSGGPGLLADGRMAIVWANGGIAEVRT